MNQYGSCFNPLNCGEANGKFREYGRVSREFWKHKKGITLFFSKLLTVGVTGVRNNNKKGPALSKDNGRLRTQYKGVADDAAATRPDDILQVGGDRKPSLQSDLVIHLDQGLGSGARNIAAKDS